MNDKIIKCFKLPEILSELRKNQKNKEYFLKQIHINELKKQSLKIKLRQEIANFKQKLKALVNKNFLF